MAEAARELESIKSSRHSMDGESMEATLCLDKGDNGDSDSAVIAGFNAGVFISGPFTGTAEIHVSTKSGPFEKFDEVTAPAFKQLPCAYAVQLVLASMSGGDVTARVYGERR